MSQAGNAPGHTRQNLKSVLQPLGRGMRRGLGGLGRGRQRLWCAIGNGWRRLRRSKLPDYVVITLDHEISERAPSVPWWYAYLPWLKLPLSLEYLETALERIAGDPDVRGVIFLFKGPTLSLAKAQSLIQLLDRFRAWDADYRSQSAQNPQSAQNAGERAPKQIVAHIESAGAGALALAAAADHVSMTPQGSWNFTGLRIAPLYLKDALARIGVEVEVAQISPWKSAFDPWQHSRMSPESRQQYEWLLDGLFADFVQAIAHGRGLDPERVRAQIDRAPLTAEQAQAAGLVDVVLYEDELPQHLGASHLGASHLGASHLDISHSDTTNSDKPEKPARLARYAQVRGLLYHHARKRHAQAVGVLTLEGAIVPGESRRFPMPLPLVGEKLMGSRSVTQQIRAARKNSRLGAVVVHVDSGGGSAFASDLIWRELKLLAQEKPVVVYMGDVAASGGYYIATPGRQIVAQSATLTGSIGVVTAKPVTGGATEKLGANREVIQRGAHAGIYAEDRPWTPDERAKIFEDIEHVYATFKTRVAAGRDLPYDSLDAIANGRVWTGKQALEHKLVDALGDLRTAVDLACAAAELPQDGSVATVNLPPGRGRELARPAQPQDGAPDSQELAALARWLLAAYAGEWEQILGSERTWLWADGLPRIEG